MKRVLFVCIENSNRSQMAEAFARPSGAVNPKAIAAMKELGYDLTRHESKSLDQLPDMEYDVAVTMGCGDACPMVRAKRREEWNIPDPRDLPPEQFRAVCDQIGQRVRALVESL
jgi:arsenate reductase (thioredoxin)